MNEKLNIHPNSQISHIFKSFYPSIYSFNLPITIVVLLVFDHLKISDNANLPANIFLLAYWLDKSNDFTGIRPKRIFKMTIYTFDDTVSLTEITGTNRERLEKIFLRRIHLPCPQSKYGLYQFSNISTILQNFFMQRKIIRM